LPGNGPRRRQLQICRHADAHLTRAHFNRMFHVKP
jgi:hypothetical protein